MAIEHDAQNQQFTTTRDGKQAGPAYALAAPGLNNFIHTFFDETLRGQGIAEELARAALAFAQEQGLKVKTSCTYMAGCVRHHHAGQADLLA